MSLRKIVVSLLCAGTFSACHREEAPVAGSAPPPPSSARPGPASAPAHSASPTVVTVNGTAITEADVSLELSGSAGSHGGQEHADQREGAIESLIRKELFRQAAAKAGLNKDPDYLEKRRILDAQVREFERKTLSELFFRKEIAGKAKVDEGRARAWYDANQARVRTELHVMQILKKNEPGIQAAKAELDAGKPFEQVAADALGPLPPGTGTPWDLGFLKWVQIPQVWRDVVYDLPPGGVSGIIKGPNNRFWIVKVVEKREAPDATFEKLAPAIGEALQAEAVEALRLKTEADLRAAAKIERAAGK